jgi:hypothetical protein
VSEFHGLLPAGELRTGDHVQYWGMVAGLHVYPDRVEFSRIVVDDALWVTLDPDMEIWVNRTAD